MVKEEFSIAGSRDVLSLIDEAGKKAGFARGQAFEDFLTFVRCSLAGQTMEEEYLETVRKGYDKGKKGNRGMDIIVKAFAQLVHLMDKTEQDVLGDIFQSGVTRGENGQYFTPGGLSELMERVVVGNVETKERKSVCDPASGSGRTLLAIGKKHPHWEYTAQDVDHRCAQMSAINMGLNGLNGWTVWQNSLTLEVHRVYKIGLNLHGGVIREVPIEKSPFNYDAQVKEQLKQPKNDSRQDNEPQQQLDLF